MKNDKYDMFKNFMHNELGISKDDIHIWVKEAVQEEARKVVAKTYDNFDPKKVVEQVLTENNYFLNNRNLTLREVVFDRAGKHVAEAFLKKISLTIIEDK